jgi:hypothetical protein
MGPLFTDADLVHSYSRAQAVADGVLVDLTDPGSPQTLPAVREAGIRYPLAVTRAVFDSVIGLTPAARRAGNDIEGRTWDLAYMLARAARSAAPGQTVVWFTVYAVVRRLRPQPVRLKCVCGPGDRGEPVLTVMLPGED